MTQKQQDTIYAAYLCLCRHKKYVDKWANEPEIEKVRSLLKEMGEAFPFIQLRIGASILR